MDDFEQDLADALANEAERAAEASGLADRARTRHRRLRRERRRSGTVAAVVAVAAIGVPVAWAALPGGDAPRRIDTSDVNLDDVTRVTCGGASWPVLAMTEGIDADVDDAQVRAAFADVLASMPMDAPLAIRKDGPEKAAYVVLAADPREVTVGVGDWTSEGPQPGAMPITLAREDQRLVATSWGDCSHLQVALPAGQSRVEIAAPQGGVDPTSTEITVLVHELQCSSARELRPHLSEPTVVKRPGRVLLRFFSDEVVGGVTCPGNAPIETVVHLSEPLGDRTLWDAGAWPPAPIEVAGR